MLRGERGKREGDGRAGNAAAAALLLRHVFIAAVITVYKYAAWESVGAPLRLLRSRYFRGEAGEAANNACITRNKFALSPSSAVFVDKRRAV